MGIESVWKSETGKELARVGDPEMLLSSFVLGSIDLSDTICLRFIDAYGDACFNQLQIQILAKELDAAVINTKDSQIKEHIGKIAELARNANQAHTYIWFIGD